MLSLADLGFSIALPQSLYDPLAKKDEQRICSLMKFYEKVYAIICVAVIVIGLALLPFLPLIINMEEANEISHIYLIYILFILQSAASYLFIYKRTLFTADQKNHYISIIECIVSVVSTLVQIAILFFWKNYILYLVTSIVFIVAQNVYISAQCNKKYPFLKDMKSSPSLSKAETRDLTKKVYALFIYKVANAVESGTDNMIMTACVGLIITGLCSNYTLVITSLSGILLMAMAAATSSIGNLIVTESKERTYEVYQLLTFIGFWLYGVCAICLVVLLDPFIKIWLGEEYLITISAVIVLCLNFYITGVQNVNSNFRNAYGLFYEGRYRPVLMIIVNIGSSIILAKWIGVTGIFIGTLLSRVLTVGIFDPYIVYKYGLHANLREYYLYHCKYHVVALIIGSIIFLSFSQWRVSSFLMLVIKAIVVFLYVNIAFFIVFHKNRYFLEAIMRIKGIFGDK